MNLKKVFFFLLCCGFVPPALYGQTLPLINYTIQNGLPEATVYCSFIDKTGYLWVGTQGGASSFDGRQFKVIDSQSGLPDNHVTAITEAADGSMIVFGHRSGAISFYSNGIISRFRSPDFKNSALINSLSWQKNTLYVATNGNGLYCINFTKIGYGIKHFTKRDGLAADSLNQIAVKGNNELWLATTGGLSAFNISSSGVTGFTAFKNENVSTVYQRHDGATIVGVHGGVKLLMPGTLPVINLTGPIGERHVNRIMVDDKNNIWLATNKGVGLLSGDAPVKWFTKINGLLSDPVYDIVMDREHNLWFGQDDGISCYKSSPFELFTQQDGLIYNEVYAITEDRTGQLWVGTAQGVSIFKYKAGGIEKVRDITVKDGLPDDFIYDMYEDSRGNIWIACVNKGAACFIPKENKLLVFDQNNGLAGKAVASISEDAKGHIWLATLDKGVAMYDYAKKQMESFTKDKGFPSNAVWTIHRDSKRQLWFGSRDAGLIKQDTAGKFTVVAGQQGLPNQNFGSVSSDRAGNIWIASIGDGIFKYNGKSFTQYGTRQGIKSNNPYFIFCDNINRVWLGTNVGVDLFDPQTLNTRHYLKNDGFTGIETNQNAVYQAHNGDMWIGTVNGLMRYHDNERNKQEVPAPLVYITKKHLLYDDQDINRNKLNYEENYITFNYLGLSLSNAEKIRYSYRLTGFDKKWSPLSTESKVSYANLPPGDYAFMVKAGYRDGNWSKPVSFSFKIGSPFYKTWWFILLTCAAAYGVVAFLYKYRVNQLLKLEKMRNKIASDLHDDIGSALSSISIFSEVADQQLAQQVSTERTREIIGHISYHSRNMLDAMDDIVWAVNPKNDHFNDLEVRMREFAIPLMEAKNIAFQFDTQNELKGARIRMDARKNIFLIFKECINNILKHSACTEMKLSIKKLGNKIELLISDNGKGFDTQQLNNRNGLGNMKKRASEIQADLELVSEQGKGTTVRLTVNII